MDMEMEVKDELSLQAERLAGAAIALEAAAQRLSAIDLEGAQSRTADLEAKLAAAEATIASLRAQAAGNTSTQPTQHGVAQQAAQPRKALSLAAKELVASGDAGVSTGIGSGNVGSVDAALSSLSIEQRIAVKAGLMRGGLLG